MRTRASVATRTASVFKDYAENVSWSDDLEKLLAAESRNERQHRSGRPAIPGFSVETAAKLILMDNVAGGSLEVDMPKATTFLIFRKTAAEARVIGYLARSFITPEWRAEVAKLDYAELMKRGQQPS